MMMEGLNQLWMRVERTLLSVLFSAALIIAPSMAQEDEPVPDDQPPPPAEEATEDEGQINAEIVIVQGTPGEEGYAEDFGTVADYWKKAAKQGLAKASFIGSDDEKQRESLKEVITGMKADSPVPLWIVLVGHGTFDRRQANFNLTGPDVSAQDMAKWIDEFTRPVIVVHGGAASAPFIRRLSRDGRVVISATRSGTEINYTRFGTFMGRALEEAEADLNNDGQASVYECFLYACRQTKAYYETNGLLATEHALMDDNGDGRGTGLELLERFEINPQKVIDGDFARLWSLALNESEKGLTPLQRKRRNTLEREILDLRRRRSEFEEAEFYAKVEPILTDIAKIYEENVTESEEKEDAAEVGTEKEGDDEKKDLDQKEPLKEKAIEDEVEEELEKDI